MLYGLYHPPGQKHIENLEDDGQLIKLFRSHARNILQRKRVNVNFAAYENEYDEFKSSRDKLLFGDIAKKSNQRWYVDLKNLKTPGCLDSKTLLFTDHADHDEFSEEYGDAARHLIVLNDLARYAEELGYIFSDSEFEKTNQALQDLERLADDACEFEALKSNLEGASESDKYYFEREHIKLIMTYVDGLFDAINFVECVLQNELETLSDSEQFIGELMLHKHLSVLRRCADILYEL